MDPEGLIWPKSHKWLRKHGFEVPVYEARQVEE